MEPPTKRPRFGPAPFDSSFDDPEADELNERPEVVNARRDPAVQLERSRAFAAFKLKSAFERIFEKYEKDFTGVGDEVDLRTGEIVVNNGHIESLKEAQLGGEEGADADSGNEAASEAGSLNEEEMMLRGREDNRLSLLGQSAVLPSAPMPLQIGVPPFWGGGRSGPALPSFMYPGQMQLGGFPMQYPAHIPAPTTDPTWATPELPSPFHRNALALGEASPPVKKKVARLSLGAAREQDGADEDDILLNVSASGTDKTGEGGLVMKQKLLLARSPAETGSAKKRGVAQGPKPTQSAAEVGRPRKLGRPPKKKGFPVGELTAVNDPSPGKVSTKQDLDSLTQAGESRSASASALPKGNKPSPAGASAETDTGSLAQVGESRSVDASTPAKPNKSSPASSSTSNTSREKGAQGDVPEESEIAFGMPPPLAVSGTLVATESEERDVFVNFSDGEQRFIEKPRNQTIRVEILARKPPDIACFRTLTLEPSDPSPTESQTGLTAVTEVIGLPGTSQENKTSKSGSLAPSDAVPVEAFSRNVVDPTYDFSDEDEPMRRREDIHRKPNKATKVTTNGPAALREISHNVGLQVASHGRGPYPDPFQEVENPPPDREGSPTLSLCWDDAVDHDGSDLVAPSGTRDLPPPTNPPGETPQQRGKQSTAAAVEGVWSEKGRRLRLAKTQPQYATTTPRRPSVAKRLGHSATREIPETSPYVPPVVTPLPGRNQPADPILEVPFSDPALIPEEADDDTPISLDRVPSPTLTDPSSRPQPTFPSSPQKPPPPQTPTKTPKCRSRPKTNHQPPPTTTATTTTTKKRKGMLSLLPFNNTTTNDDDDDDQDELSFLTPLRPTPAPGTAIRSTPASHHVRLALSAPASASSSSAAAAALSKLKRNGGKLGSGGGGNLGTPTLIGTGTGTGKRGKGKGRRGALGGPGGTGLPTTPSSKRVVDVGLLVQTPGGTMRRCGENGFRCEREFCFSCL